MNEFFQHSRITYAPTQTLGDDEASWWRRYVPVTPTELADQFSDQLGGVAISGTYFDPDGAILSFNVECRRGEHPLRYIRLDSLLEEKIVLFEGPYIRSGIGVTRDDLRLLENCAQALNALQQERLSTKIFSPHGLTWAAMGFVPDAASWPHLRAGMRQVAEDLSMQSILPADVADRLKWALGDTSPPEAVRVIVTEDTALLPGSTTPIGRILLSQNNVHWNAVFDVNDNASVYTLTSFAEAINYSTQSQSPHVGTDSYWLPLVDALKYAVPIAPALRSEAVQLLAKS